MKKYVIERHSIEPDLKKIMDECYKNFQNELSKSLKEYFDPYLRKAGVKGKISKWTLKKAAIKLIVESDLITTKYMLTQRGEIISPILTLNSNLEII